MALLAAHFNTESVSYTSWDFSHRQYLSGETSALNTCKEQTRERERHRERQTDRQTQTQREKRLLQGSMAKEIHILHHDYHHERKTPEFVLSPVNIDSYRPVRASKHQPYIAYQPLELGNASHARTERVLNLFYDSLLAGHQVAFREVHTH